jgi:hypothetical protein
MGKSLVDEITVYKMIKQHYIPHKLEFQVLLNPPPLYFSDVTYVLCLLPMRRVVCIDRSPSHAVSSTEQSCSKGWLGLAQANNN